MNGLVGYGSSDDEQDPAIPDSALPSAVSGHLNKTPPNHHAVTSSNSERTAGLSDDFVGPARPTSFEQYSEPDEEAVSSEVLPALPEGDLRRLLTQPSHPVSSLPSDPTSEADPAVSEKIKHFLELKSRGFHFNQDLTSNPSFRNPNLFLTLLRSTGLPLEAQFASVLPKHSLDLDGLPHWATKDKLLTSQQTLHAQYEVERSSQISSSQRTIDFVPATRTQVQFDHPNRKRESP